MDGVTPTQVPVDCLSRAFGLVIAARLALLADGFDEAGEWLFVNAALLDVVQVFDSAGVTPEVTPEGPLSVAEALRAASASLESCAAPEATRVRALLRRCGVAGC